MPRILTLIVSAMIVFLFMAQDVPAAGWERYVEFRDTVKPDTVPMAYVRMGKISVQKWKADEKAKLVGDIKKVFARAPGVFRFGASQGPIPFYRITSAHNSYGGHGALWLSYFGVGVVSHEITHVADAEHKIVRSEEFRKLVEPRIRKLRALMRKNGIPDISSKEADKRKDLYLSVGLPSAYAAVTIQETLAEYVRAWVTNKSFRPPADIKKFLEKKLINATPRADPSVAQYRKGKAARLNRDYKEALLQLNSAIEHDNKFAEAYIERGLVFEASKQPDKAIEDFTRSIGLMSEYDWHAYKPYNYRGRINGRRGEYDKALKDFMEAKRLSPKAPGLDSAISTIKFMSKMKKRKTQ